MSAPTCSWPFETDAPVGVDLRGRRFTDVVQQHREHQRHTHRFRQQREHQPCVHEHVPLRVKLRWLFAALATVQLREHVAQQSAGV